ncbi:MAG: hypothetical protein M3Q30_00120 [Actinomycetota bacterium]|nr:hypothetical protein [Actinomycetota bacterium]
MRDVLMALALLPGFAYGVGWFVLGGYAGHGTWTHLIVRGIGLVLAAAACNCAWRLAKDLPVWRAFVGYAVSLGAVLVVLWALLAP